MSGCVQQRFGNLLVASGTAGRDHATRFRCTIAERLQIVRFLGEILLAAGRSFGHRNGIGKLFQRRRNIHEILNHSTDQRLLNALLELMQFGVQFTSDLLRFGRMAQAAGAQLAELIAERFDLIAELQNFHTLMSGQTFGDLFALVHDQSDRPLSQTFVIDGGILQPTACLLQTTLNRMGGLLQTGPIDTLDGLQHAALQIAEFFANLTRQSFGLGRCSFAVVTQIA